MKFLRLLEAIAISDVKPYLKLWKPDEKILERFRKAVEDGYAIPGTSKWRIMVPVDESKGIVYISDTMRLVGETLERYGYRIVDYDRGIALDKYGRKTRIGKILNKLVSSKDPDVSSNAKHVIHLYATDRYRNIPYDEAGSGSDNGKKYIVISAHPYDLVGASANRRWTSCIDLYHGSKSDSLFTIVDDGYLIAYLVTEDDLNINRPIMRKLLFPYVSNEGDIVFADTGQTYGGQSDVFERTLREFLEKFNGGSWTCAYKASDESFENVDNVIFRSEEELDGKLDRANFRSDADYHEAVIAYHAKLGTVADRETIEEALDSIAPSRIVEYLDSIALGDDREQSRLAYDMLLNVVVPRLVDNLVVILHLTSRFRAVATLVPLFIDRIIDKMSPDDVLAILARFVDLFDESNPVGVDINAGLVILRDYLDLHMDEVSRIPSVILRDFDNVIISGLLRRDYDVELVKQIFETYVQSKPEPIRDRYLKTVSDHLF